MLCAANYIHAGAIVHRDLKPANVLIDKNCHVKFCDFGLARTIATPSKASSKQKDERPRTPRVGTQIYMAPEALIRNPKYDFAVDIWSIGCILGELLLNFVEKNDDS